MFKISHIYTFLAFALVAGSVPVFGGELDELKAKTQEAIDKNKEGTKRLIERTEVNTQRAIDDVREIPEKNEDGTERLTERLEKNTQNSIDDVREGLDHGKKEAQEEIDAVIAKNAPATQPADLTNRQTTLTQETSLKPLPAVATITDFQSRGVTLTPSQDYYYYSINEADVTKEVKLAPGTQLELVKVVTTEEDAQLNAVLAALNANRTEDAKLCGRTSVFKVTGADVDTVNLHKFKNCK